MHRVFFGSFWQVLGHGAYGRLLIWLHGGLVWLPLLACRASLCLARPYLAFLLLSVPQLPFFLRVARPISSLGLQLVVLALRNCGAATGPPRARPESRSSRLGRATCRRMMRCGWGTACGAWRFRTEHHHDTVKTFLLRIRIFPRSCFRSARTLRLRGRSSGPTVRSPRSSTFTSRKWLSWRCRST